MTEENFWLMNHVPVVIAIDIKKQSEVLVNKLGCPRSFVGGMLHAIASDFSDMKTWE